MSVPAPEPSTEPSMQISADIVQGIWDTRESTQEFLARITHIHFLQATVIRGERARAEVAERELAERELHHFETEQENERLQANLEQERAEHESTLHTGQAYMQENARLKADHTDSEKQLIDMVNNQADTIAKIRAYVEANQKDGDGMVDASDILAFCGDQ